MPNDAALHSCALLLVGVLAVAPLSASANPNSAYVEGLGRFVEVIVVVFALNFFLCIINCFARSFTLRILTAIITVPMGIAAILMAFTAAPVGILAIVLILAQVLMIRRSARPFTDPFIEDESVPDLDD